MFDKYIVVEDTLKRVPGGLQFGVRLPYYRGLGLSMVETMDVTVDGERVPEEGEVWRADGMRMAVLEQQAAGLPKRLRQALGELPATWRDRLVTD